VIYGIAASKLKESSVRGQKARAGMNVRDVLNTFVSAKSHMKSRTEEMFDMIGSEVKPLMAARDLLG
jgi:predicted neutral ceramidase superfamily lipid hydrolase